MIHHSGSKTILPAARKRLLYMISFYFIRIYSNMSLGRNIEICHDESKNT